MRERIPVQRGGGHYRFIHRTFQEHLPARPARIFTCRSPVASGLMLNHLVKDSERINADYAILSVSMRTGFIERTGKIEELDRSFDLEFWQAQPPSVRFAAAWSLIVHAAKVQGIDVRQLRLQRSVETFHRQQR